MMLQLRQRSRSGGSSGDYVRVNSDDPIDEDDDFDYHPIPNASKAPSPSSSSNHTHSRSSAHLSAISGRIKKIVPRPSNSCVKCCWVFSLAGIVFLSSIAYMLAIQSPYIRVSEKYSHQKHKLVDGISGAIILYSITLLMCSYVWWRSFHSAVPEENTSRFID